MKKASKQITDLSVRQPKPSFGWIGILRLAAGLALVILIGWQPYSASGSHVATIVSVSPETGTFQLGEWITITVRAKNGNSTSRPWQILNISLPDDTTDIEIVSDSLESSKEYVAGFVPGGCKYGAESCDANDHPMVEGESSPWAGNSTKELKIRVKPTSAGQFRFRVKTVSAESGPATHWDPGGSGSGVVIDQQNEWAYQYTLTVEQEKEPTKIRVDGKSATVGQSISLTAKLEEGDFPSFDIQGASVDFYVGNSYVGSDNTDGNGDASVSYTAPNSADNYTIKAEFTGDDDYNPSSDTANLKVEDVVLEPTKIRVDGKSATVGQSISLTAKLEESDFPSFDIQGASVDFYVGNSYVGSDNTDGNGDASVSYTAPNSADNYTIKAEFTGDDDYLSSSDTDTLIVSDTTLDTQIQAHSKSTTASALVTLTARLEEGDFPFFDIQGASVDFYVGNSYVGSDNTDGNGDASVSYTAPNSADNYTIKAEFTGDDDYNPSSDTANLKVEDVVLEPTKIRVDGKSATVGQSISLTAKLEESDFPSFDIQGASVDFYVGNSYVGSDNTDGNGDASVSYTAPNSADNYTIKAEFTGDDDYLSSSDTDTLSVSDVLKEPTKIRVDGKSATVGQSISLTAKLEESDFPSFDIQGASVDFYVGNSYVGSDNTDGNGDASVSYTAPNSADNYTIKAEFTGDDDYNPSSDTANLEVIIEERLLVVQAKDESVTSGEKVTLTAHLEDAFLPNGGLRGLIVEFYIDDSFIGSDTTDGNGDASVSYTAPNSVGDYTFKAKFLGNSLYSGRSDAAKLTVIEDFEGPDLVVQDIFLDPAAPSEGEFYRIKAVVRNNGDETADAGFFANQEIYFFVDDSYAGLDNYDALGAGKSITLESPRLIAPAKGDHEFITIADANFDVSESSETNNDMAETIFIGSSALPDLDVTKFDSPPSADAGQDVSVSFTIENLGGASSGDFIVTVYISSNSTISTGDRRLDTVSVRSIAAGSDRSEIASVTIPADLTEATWYIGVLADSDRIVVESNETNNTASQSIRITVIEISDLELLVRFAPVMRLHADELYRPHTVDLFINHSALVRKRSVFFRETEDTTISESPTTLTVTSNEGSREVTGGDLYLDLSPDIRSHNASGDFAAWYRTYAGEYEYSVYGRIVEDAEATVIQYWFFYPFNDWENKHEGDWEVVMLQFPNNSRSEIAAGDISPSAILGYSQHLDGTKIRLEGAETIDGRVVVYVALGSHANYFRECGVGYNQRLHLGLDRVSATGTTLVPKGSPSTGEQVTYVVRDISLEEWIQFGGKWGEYGPKTFGDDGPAGPAFSGAGARWDRPSRWLADLDWDADRWVLRDDGECKGLFS